MICDVWLGKLKCGTSSGMGALFPPDADLVPLVAYICTRVAPVAQSLPA